MTGVLADVNIQGHVDYIMSLVIAPPWRDIWNELALTYANFGDLGLKHDSPDSEIWRVCQEERYVLITSNRNHDDAGSLEATIRLRNLADSLPVLTIADPDELRRNREYAGEVVVSLMRTLLESTISSELAGSISPDCSFGQDKIKAVCCCHDSHLV